MSRRSIWRGLAALAACAAVVAGLIYAGRWTRLQLDARQHYDVALADIDAPVPPGVDRGKFLSEVQYLGSLPDRISALDPGMILRLASAFKAHPWVEHVDGVSLRSADGPRARLPLRTPVLAIGDRVVDGQSVLLPTGTATTGLIVYHGPVAPPKLPAGAVWDEPAIEEAVRFAAALQPFQDVLGIDAIEIKDGGLIGTGKIAVVWGRPGHTEDKIARLRELSQTMPLPEKMVLDQK